MIYNIPAHLPFAEQLVKGLLRRHPEPQGTIIYLPSNSAMRAFHEAMGEQSEGDCQFLPELRTIDEEEIPESATLNRRQRLLAVAELLAARRLPPNRLFGLATEFLSLYDSALLNEVSLAVGLKELAAKNRGGWAEHWQKLLATLRVISRDYPNLLKQRQLIDPRMLQISRLGEFVPPADKPIIVAGATGGDIEAYKRFINKIAAAANGSVVLPGLDMDMDEESWQNLTANHPQYAMRKLLAETPRSEVKTWHEGADHYGARKGRMVALRRAMRPPHAPTELNDCERLVGVSMINAEDERQEAALIALALLRALKQGKKAALVTKDRSLARAVAAELANYSHPVNDAAGTPLLRTAIAKFLSLILESLKRGATAPSAMLALLSSPLNQTARLDEDELSLVRENLGGTDFLGVARRLNKYRRTAEKLRFIYEQLAALKAAAEKATPLHTLLVAHLKAAEALAPDLWQNRHGEEVAAILRELLRAAEATAHSDPYSVTADNYPQVFYALLADDVVRPQSVLGAKLFIWGSLHARFQKLDLAVLGGLSEGNWPPSANFNPWLSRGMMKRLGLGDAQTRIGLAAHDFIQCFGTADQVILSNAKRRNYKPLAPSRWLERLEHLLPTAAKPTPETELSAVLKKRSEIRLRSRRLPSFALPKTAKPPNRFRLTDLKYLTANPYVFYVRSVLKLRQRLAAEVGDYFVLRGTLSHLLAAEYAKLANDGMDPGDGIMGKVVDKLIIPYVAAADKFLFLGAFLRSFAAEFRSWHQADRKPKLFAEVGGEVKLGDYTIAARADCIKKCGGGFEVVDFKTGAVPSGKAVKNGNEPQLPMLAYILANGGFADLGKGTAQKAYYLKFSMGDEAKEKAAIEGGELLALGNATAADCLELLDGYLKDGAVFTAAAADPHLAHIIRYQECLIP